MNCQRKLKIKSIIIGVIYFLGPTSANFAALTDLADAPTTSMTSSNVLPNIMFTLDDSGSMQQDYTPDYVKDKLCYDSKDDDGSIGNRLKDCFPGDPLFMSPDFNYQYYNPEIYYQPPVNAAGTPYDTSFDSFGNQNPAAAKTDPYGLQKKDMLQNSVNTVNLKTLSWPDRQWCNGSSGGTACVTNTSATGYKYPDNTYSYGFGKSGCKSYDTFYGNGAKCINYVYVAPYYWRISASEWCTDDELTSCSSTNNGGTPAYVRWCTNSNLTNCQSRKLSGYGYLRNVGQTSGGSRVKNYTMTRVNIVTGQTYPKVPARTDCAGSVCTYDEEIQNFANWFSYYRTRLQSMKTAVSLAFKPIDNKFRVGFNTISYTGVSNSDSRFLTIADYGSTQKSTWYNKLFGANIAGGTPLRTSLKKIGDMYAGLYPSADPIQYSCQQNFTILTTDGYWNDSFSMGNYDNNPSDGYSRRSGGQFDGGSATNASDTLSDVAMYFYKTDLRPSMPNIVFQEKPSDSSSDFADNAQHQHMTTFTLGLGVSGVLKYKKNYDTSPTGDFAKIKSGTGGCIWDANCNWPKPTSNDLTAVDDLWHAAVNGRGKYFSARDPAELVSGLKDALGAIGNKLGSAAAGATSTPFLTSTDNAYYMTTFMPDIDHDDWSGEVTSKGLDPVNGQVLPGKDWDASVLLSAQVGATSDTRTIYTFNGNKITPKQFQYSALSTVEKAYFDNKGSLLGQYSTLDATQQGIINSGSNMVGFLRGRTANVGTIYRDRQKALGDTVHSKPIYIRTPLTNYSDSGYAAFKASSAIVNRRGILYVGSNDGMIHAFNGTSSPTKNVNGTDGDERWAYVPKMLLPNLYLLAEKFYFNGHRFFVDGEQSTGDAKFSDSTWHTLLLTGMGKGARGFVALDVTNPDSPVPLWEFCHDATLCATSDTDLGYSFGNPVLTKRAFDGKWVVVVTSGYNNVSPGTGIGYLYVLDAETGAILSKTSTGSGSTSYPSGLGKINIWVNDPVYDNTGKYVYGGDLNGDLWRFDLTLSTVTVMKIGSTKGPSSNIQPITTKPELVECYGAKMVLLGTGQLLGASDLTTTAIQSIYGIKDKGSPYSAASIRNAPLVQQTLTASGNNYDVSNNTVSSSDNGWYIDLPAAQRVNVDPIVALGTLGIASNSPNSTDPCTSGGSSVFYAVDACSGGITVPGATAGIGNTSSMVAGVTAAQTSNGVKVPVQNTDGTTVIRDLPNRAAATGGQRVSWKELIQ